MGNKFFIGAIVVFVAVFSTAKTTIENPNIKSPVGRGTVPPSSYQEGLITSPSPMDQGSDLVVTGNVGGGKHFRGVLPYNAVTDFGGGLGSSSLDSFLRQSYNPGGFGNYTGEVTPYYSPTRTVTSMKLGTSSVFRPLASSIKLLSAEEMVFSTEPSEKAEAVDVGAAMLNVRLRPLSMTVDEMEKFISMETEKFLQARGITAAKYQQQREQFEEQLRQVEEKASELERKLTMKKEILVPPTTLESPVPQNPAEQTEMAGRIDVYELMKKQLAESREVVSQAVSTGGIEKAESGKKPEGEHGRIGEEVKGKQGRISEEAEAEKGIKRKDFLEEFSREEIAVKAKTILGEHKTFASFTDDKFNRYMRAGEEYLKHGKYYRAADAYTLASIYKANDPLAYAGKSHALFAAGEYMSSALFLARALEIFPGYSQFKIDIEAMVGDRDKLESRVLDVEQWQKESGSAELQFLLGYIYHQMGRGDRAKEMIDKAYEKMPDSPPVISLRESIYGRMTVGK